MKLSVTSGDPESGCRLCRATVHFQCMRCNQGYCEECIRAFGEKATRILLEKVSGKGDVTFGKAKIFDNQSQAFCPNCYGELLDRSVKTGQWVVESEEEAYPSCVRIGEVSVDELQNKIQNVRQVLDQAYQILDLRQQMAADRVELLKSLRFLLLEPRGYGPRTEYRKVCNSIMKNAKAVRLVARAWQKALKKMGIKENPPEIEQALKDVEKAKREVGFRGRIGL